MVVLDGDRLSIEDVISVAAGAGMVSLAPSSIEKMLRSRAVVERLAHMALVLMGEGEAEFMGRRMPGGEALRLAGIEPLALASKEGISLVNGTQAMLAVGCLELSAAEVLTDTAEVACAMTLDALRGTPRAFDQRLHAVRPHPGQRTSAEHLSRLLEGSEIRASHVSCRRVQDAYSLRCAPQVHGAVRDTLAEARRVFSIELNAATDNPLVFDE